MRILVTVHGFLTPSMTFVYNQVGAYVAEQHEVKIIACEILNQDIFPWEDIVKINERKDVSYYGSKIKRGLGVEYTLYNKSFTEKFKEEVNGFRPDIIHVHFGVQLVRIYPALKKIDTPVLVTFHGYDASKLLRNKRYVSKLRQIMAQKNVYATTVSEDMRERLNFHGISVSRTHIDYLGVDVNFFKPEQKKSDSISLKTFLQVSNFVPKKGHEFTIRAFAKYVTSENLVEKKLILAGDGPLLTDMKALVKTEGVESQVIFPGLVNRNQVKDLMQSADCFVHHSVTAADGDMEGLPTVIMEAMAMELPVISTNHAGIPELINDERYGLLVNEKDVEAYTDAFKKIEGVVDSNSRERIKKHFNLHENTKKILEIFDRIVNEP